MQPETSSTSLHPIPVVSPTPANCQSVGFGLSVRRDGLICLFRNWVEIGDGSDDPLFTAFDLSYRLLHKERQLLVKSDEYLHHIHITA